MLLTSQHFDEHITSLKTGLVSKRDLIMDSLKRELKDEISFFTPNGGVHLWCKLNVGKLTDHILFKEALKQKMVFTPATTLGTQQQYFRLTLVVLIIILLTKGYKDSHKPTKNLNK
jgi:GntR family transcriptional regulator, regulator for abcA and norABC